MSAAASLAVICPENILSVVEKRLQKYYDIIITLVLIMLCAGLSYKYYLSSVQGYKKARANS